MSDLTITHSVPETDGIVLPAILDAIAAEHLCTALRDRLTGGIPTVLRGDTVDRVSTLCVQVLLAAALQAGRQGVRFSLVSPSAPLRAALGDLGVAAHLLTENA